MILGGVVVSTFAYVAAKRQRTVLADAMRLDGFTGAEVARALRYHDRGQRDCMADYCREIVERNAFGNGPAATMQRDWTRADAYREYVE